jgi:4-diphosphocytidyl-2-C-methyl-D-erythritol kinase
MTTQAFAPAKVNLFLHVAPPSPDGFHPLVSLMVFADVGDRLTLEPSDRLELVIQGEFGLGLSATDDNLVLRAVRALFATLGRDPPPMRLVLDKVLPIAAGLGGGSSDAGAALRLVRDHFALAVDNPALEAIAASLGSDGAACFRQRAVLARGRGELLEPVEGLPALHAVLVNPKVASPTGGVYRAYDAAGAPGDAEAPPMPDRFADSREAAAFFKTCRNDLEPPAVALTPTIGAVLRALQARPESLLVRVSGSGATCFALCADADAARRLAADLEGEHPAWWVRACRLA